MKIKDRKLDRLLAKKSVEPELKSLYLDVQKGKLYTWTGEVLAIITPEAIEPSDKSGTIPWQAFRDARKKKGLDDILYLNCSDSTRIGKFPRHEVNPFDPEHIQKHRIQKRFRVRINVQTLQELSQALNPDSSPMLELVIGESPDSEIFVHGDKSGIGIIFAI